MREITDWDVRSENLNDDSARGYIIKDELVTILNRQTNWTTLGNTPWCTPHTLSKAKKAYGCYQLRYRDNDDAKRGARLPRQEFDYKICSIISQSSLERESFQDFIELCLLINVHIARATCQRYIVLKCNLWLFEAFRQIYSDFWRIKGNNDKKIKNQ